METEWGWMKLVNHIEIVISYMNITSQFSHLDIFVGKIRV